MFLMVSSLEGHEVDATDVCDLLTTPPESLPHSLGGIAVPSRISGMTRA